MDCILITATREVISRVPRAGKLEALKAIEAADRALYKRTQSTAFKRSNLLKSYYDLIVKHKLE